MRMDVKNDPDIDFPVVDRLDLPARRRADRARDPGHPAGRGGGPRRSRASTRSTPTSAKATRTTFVQLDIGTPIDRAVNDVRDAIAQIRGDLPDGILEPQVVRARHHRRRRSPASPSISTDMTLEQLSWYVDNTVAKRAALGARHGRGQPHRRRQRARSGSSSIRPSCSRSASPPARSTSSSAQININAAGGRAEIAGSEQSVRVLGNAAQRLSRSARPRSRRRRPHGQARRHRRGPRPLCRAAQLRDA